MTDEIFIQLLTNPQGALALLTPALIVTLLLRAWSIPLFRERVFGWIKKLPKAWQPLPPFILAMAVAGLEGYQAGLRGQALTLAILGAGGITGGLAIGIHHALKRAWLLIVGLAGKGPSVPAVVLVVALGSGALNQSCTLIQARTALDAARELCSIILAERKEIQAEAQRQGLAPVPYAEALCALPDVVAPFLGKAQGDAADEAVGAAKRQGAVQ